MLLPSSGPTNSVGFSDYQHVYTNQPQYKPLIYSTKIEAACSVDIFVRISKTASYRDTERKNSNINSHFNGRSQIKV